MGNKIVHFELPVTDSEKMERFYSDLFGWKFEKQSMPGMDYWMIRTESQSDLDGGMYRKMAESERPRFYVQVDDVDGHAERLKLAGGLVVVEKQEIPGTGWSILAQDPEGNTLGLFQPFAPAQTTPTHPARSKPKRKRSQASKGKRKNKKRSKGGRRK